MERSIDRHASNVRKSYVNILCFSRGTIPSGRKIFLSRSVQQFWNGWNNSILNFLSRDEIFEILQRMEKYRSILLFLSLSLFHRVFNNRLLNRCDYVIVKRDCSRLFRPDRVDGRNVKEERKKRKRKKKRGWDQGRGGGEEEG